jgi:hypothetical protein
MPSGGRRAGAGRKPAVRKQIRRQVSFDPEVLAVLDKHTDNRSGTINKILRASLEGLGLLDQKPSK